MVRPASLISFCVVLVGCGRLGFDHLDPDDLPMPAPSLCEVVPVYPAHAGWGQHVTRSAADRDDEHQPDLDCDNPGLPCVHAGERRKLALQGIRSCDGIAASDALGAFSWRCVVEDATAVLYSTGLTRGLSALVQATGWRDNAVTATRDGEPLCASPSTSWWQTTVETLPMNDTTAIELTTPDIVYVVASAQLARGHVVVADRVAIAVLDGATLSYDAGGAPSCSTATGRVAGADAHCVISVAGASFAWIEGHIDGRLAQRPLRGVQLRATRSTHLIRLDVRATTGPGIDIADGYDLRLADVTQQGSRDSDGIYLDRVAWSRFERVRAANNRLAGIHAHGDFVVDSPRTSSFNTFSQIIAAGNQGVGIELRCGAPGNVISQAVAANNGDTGILSVCNNDNVLAHITSISNAGPGVDMDQDGRRRLSQIVTAGNAGNGLQIDVGSSDNVVVNLAAMDNGQHGVFLDANRTRFDGFLVVGNNGASPCHVIERDQPGLVIDTCTTTGADGSSTYAAGSSTAVLRTGRTAADAFVGPLTTDDPVSPFDVNATAEVVTDWWAVSGFNRAWAREGAFPSTDQPGCCNGPCRLWDWSAAPTGMLHDRSGNAVVANEPATPDAPCPAAVAGDITATTARDQELRGDGTGDDDGFCEAGEACAPPARYLINAVEILGDGTGNDDALCNSNEACRYIPHLGAALTETATAKICMFRGAAVSGVTMFIP